MKKIILLTSIGLSLSAVAQTKIPSLTPSKEDPILLDLTKNTKQESPASPYLNENNIHFYKNIDSTKASLYKMNVKKIAHFSDSSFKNKKYPISKVNPMPFYPLQKLKDSIK